MTIFDVIRYPMNSIDDALCTWHKLPIRLQNDFIVHFGDDTVSKDTWEERLAWLRKRIRELE